MRESLNTRIPKYAGGYFTVEAALLMPFVLGVILLVLYLWFFEYDRALLELDTGAIALRAAVRQDLTAQERADYAGSEARKIYAAKYAAWEMRGSSAGMSGGKVTVTMDGSLRFPFPGLSFWSGDTVWEAGVQRSGTVLRPALLLRAYRKLRPAEGGWQDSG